MKNYKALLIVSGIALVLSLAGSIWLIKENRLGTLSGSIDSSLLDPAGINISNEAELALAEDIYPVFVCACCGDPLDECDCEMAQESMDYIDSLVKTKTTKNEVILAYTKEYGLRSLIDENKQKEIKEELLASAPAERPQITIEPENYDLGDVSQKEGNVFTSFELKNEGEKDLFIDKLDTSCGCTLASVVYKGEESPYFTMPGHGYENPEWEGVSIPAGETAQLKVMYDPDLHGEFRGLAIREVYIYSNDPIDFKKTIKIELNQTP